MANSISISNAELYPALNISPGSPVAPPPSPQYTPPSNDEDNILITADGGAGSIESYTVDSSGGEDTVQFNGSLNNSSVFLGEGNDIFRLGTIDLGGTISNTTIRGNGGNDVFELIAGDRVNLTTLNGGPGSDLFLLQGSFDQVSLGGGSQNDVVRFVSTGFDGGSTFTNSFVGLGAGADLFTDGGFPLDAENSTFNGGGGTDTINLSSSTTGEGRGDGGGALINGGDGKDFLYGTADGENTVLAGSGADFVQVFEDDDSVIGGGGSDTILLGDDDDVADAGAGNDLVFGQSGDNTIDAGTGSDIVIGGVDDDDIFGGEGGDRDYLVGNSGDDTIDGGSGADLIYGDEVDAGSAAGFANFGSLTILGRNEVTNQPTTGFVSNLFDPYNNQNLSLGNLTTFFADGEDFDVNWELDDDYVDGTASKTAFAPDTTPWNGAALNQVGDILADGPGGLLLELDDEVDLTNTLIVPGSEMVYIPGFGGEDDLYEGPGDDLLIGNSGNDTMFGGGGTDEIFGGLGNDVIIGGEDSDTMSGGDGSDIFVQGINSSSNNVVATYNSTNWTFSWLQGAEPDFVTDFLATTNGAVVDRVAFQGGLAYQEIGGEPGDWTSANNDAHSVVNATGSANLNQWDSGQIIVFRGDWNGNQFLTNNSGEDILAFGAIFGRDTGDDFDVTDIGTQAIILLDAGDQTFLAANFFGGDNFDNAGNPTNPV